MYLNEWKLIIIGKTVEKQFQWDINWLSLICSYGWELWRMPWIGFKSFELDFGWERQQPPIEQNNSCRLFIATKLHFRHRFLDFRSKSSLFSLVLRSNCFLSSVTIRYKFRFSSNKWLINRFFDFSKHSNQLN